MRSWSIWPCLAVAALLAGCPTPPLPAGNLADPLALAVAPSVNGTLAGFGAGPNGVDQAQLVFIAEGDGQDLKAFQPAGLVHLFVPGPNAISAMSIPLATEFTLNAGTTTDAGPTRTGTTTLPSFRPIRMAGGAVPVSGYGYLVVAGSANRLAVIDTQYPFPAIRGQPTFPTTMSTADAIACTNGQSSISCLRVPALDVVANSGTGFAFALLAPDPTTGAQSIIGMTPSMENGKVVLSIADPSTGLDSIPLPAGKFARMTLSPDGSTLYLADTTPGTTTGVLRMTLPTATPPIPMSLTTFETPGAVKVAVPLPQNGDPAAGGLAAGDAVLAVLDDGRVETINAVTGKPALDGTPPDPDGGHPDGGGPFPIVPMNFGSPAEDIVVMPCAPASSSNPCVMTVRTGATTTVSSNANPHGFIAFVALGDGTAAPLISSPSYPWNLQPVSLIAPPPVPTTTVPTYFPLPSYGIAPVTMSTPTNLTEGYTHSETVTATFNGNLPFYDGRPAAFTTGMDGGFVLTDPEGLGPAPMIYPDAGPATPESVCVQGTGSYPQNCSYPLIGDHMRVTSLDTDCMSWVNTELVINGYQSGAVTLDPPATLPGTCTPNEVSYDAIAFAEPTGLPPPNIAQTAIGAWTVFGTASGYMGRASSRNMMVPAPPPAGGFPDAGPDSDGGVPDAGMVDAGPIQFNYYGIPFYYPTDYFPDGPSGSVSFSFTLTQGDPTLPACEDCTISFGLASGFDPLVLSSTASVSGLGISVVVVNYTLYMAVEGADSLTEIDIPNYSLTNSVNDYR